MTDDKNKSCQLEEEVEFEEDELEAAHESRAGEALYGETEKGTGDAALANNELKQLLNKVEAGQVVDVADKCIAEAAQPDSRTPVISAAGIALLGARQLDFVGFDSNGSGAVVGRVSGAGAGDVIPLTASLAKELAALNVGYLSLLRDRPGNVYQSGTDDGGASIVTRTALRVVPSSRPDLQVHVFSSSDQLVPFDVLTSGLLIRDSELESIKPKPVDYRALTQSNDYATAGSLEGPIEDGFRTAGRNRTFDAQGKFAATDRAAIVVDRTSDTKLQDVLKLLRENDEKLKASGATEQQRVEALARYVRTLMIPEGKSEQELDQEYRRFMTENGGKEVKLGDLIGSGSCAPGSLLLKLAADELGFDCALVRGNKGAHVWTTFKFEGESERQIYDVKADSYAARTSESRFHKPDAPSSARAEYVPGQAVNFKGQEWQVSSIDSQTGAVSLERTEQLTVSAGDAVRQNSGKQLQIGEQFTLADTGGGARDWVLQGIQQNGELTFARKEICTVNQGERAAIDSPLELAAGPDLQYLQRNWSTLVGGNRLLTPAQRTALATGRDRMVNESLTKQKDFRELVERLSYLGNYRTSDATERDGIKAEVDYLARIGEANFVQMRADWATTVGNNALLSPEQRAQLAVARDNLTDARFNKQEDFKKLIDELDRLEKTKPTSDAHRAELKAKAEAIAKIAEISGKYPSVVNVPVERINLANDLAALQQVAKTLSEAAPHLHPPAKAGPLGVPLSDADYGQLKGGVYADGKASEFGAQQALQSALRETALLKELMDAGKFPKGDWMFLPSAAGSPLDHMNVDGMLVDLSTGRVLNFDFASGKDNYAKYREKVNAGEPFAFSIDRTELGYRGGGFDVANLTAANKRAILEHIGAFANGTLPEYLGVKDLLTIREPVKPEFLDIKEQTKLFGEYPSARPVDGVMEAQILTREEGKKVRSTAQELADCAKALRSKTGRSATETSMMDAADAAKLHVKDVDALADKLSEGLRAAVEADRFGTAEFGFEKGKKAPTNFRIQPGVADKSRDLPERYRGVDFVTMDGGSLKSTGVEVRLFPNGEVLLCYQAGQKMKYVPMGCIQDFGDKTIKALVEAGYDPADFRDAARKFEKLKFPADFNTLRKDLDSLSTEAFWAKYPELKLLAGSVHYASDQARAARDGRTIYESIDTDPKLGSLSDAEKVELTKKTVRLREAQKNGETKWTVEEVKAIQDLEKAITKPKISEADAARLYKGMRETGGVRSEAEIKEAADLFERMKENYKPTGKNPAKATPEGIGELYARYGAVSNDVIAELNSHASKLKGQSVVDVMAQLEARPLIERANGIWQEMEQGAFPKEVNDTFLMCMEDALKAMKNEGLDPSTAARYDEVLNRYRAAVENSGAQTDAMPKNIHDFFESARRTGAVGERVWQVPQDLAPAERDLFQRRLAKFGENPLSKPTEVEKFSKLIDAETAKWAEDLQPRARSVTELNAKLQEAYRAAYEQALKEAGSAAEATKLLQSDGGSEALKALRNDWKAVNEEHSKATTELSRDCKTRAEALQAKVNEFAKTHGLPPVEIKVVEQLNGAGGHYVRGNGEFRVLTADMLNPRTGAELAGVLYHELVHLQQDNLVFRKIMDDLKIKQLSADAKTRLEQLKQIRERYNVETGARLPEPSTTENKNRWEQFVGDVATERGGKPLSDTERAKAEMLAKSFKENSPLGVRFQETADAIRVLENEQRRMGDRSSNHVAEDLIAKLASEGGENDLLRKQFFGDKPSGPLYDLVERYKKAAKDASGRATTWDETAARKAVSEHIDGIDGKGGRIDELNAERRAIYKKYSRPVFEQEATILGNKVHALESRNVLKAVYDRTAPGTGETNKPGTEPDGKPGGDKKPVEPPPRPNADESLTEIPVRDEDRRPSDPLAKDKPLDVKSLEGPNGLKLLADRLAEPKLMDKLKEYDNDAKFRDMFEKKIKEATGEEKEKLEKEYERYKKLGPGEQEIVRRSVIAEAVEAHLAKAKGREWMRTGERVLGTAGTFIAVFMLAELILSEAKSGSSSNKPANPTVK